MNNHDYLVHRLDRLENRVRRTETRLCKLMDALGIDPNGGTTDTPSHAEPTLPRDYPADPHPDERGTHSFREQIPALFKRRG